MGEGRRFGRAPPALAAFVIAFLWTSVGAAQERSGRVVVTVSTAAGDPIEGARISATDEVVFSDGEGRAILSLPAGRATVSVERLGFAPWQDEVEVPAGGEVAVSVVLQDEAVEIEGVVVTSTRLNRRIEDEPLRVEVIGREEVEEKILMTPGDIAMLLNETAGLRVQPTAPSLGGASVRIQGLRGRYTLILSDGLPLYGGQSGALGPLQIPPMDLGQVEVIKGVASALFGATALGGVVNLVSRAPRPARELLLNGSTLGAGDAILWMADKPEGPWGWSLLAGLHGQQKADVDADSWADLPSYQRVVVRPRLVWDDGAGSSVLATVGGMFEDRRGGTMDDGLTPAGTPFAEELSTRRADAGVLGRFLLSSGRFLSWRGSGSLQRHEHQFGSVLEQDQHLTGFLEGSLSGIDGAHNWVIGAALQSDSYKADDVSGFDYTHTVPALFAQDEVRLAPWLILSASGRIDDHSEYGTFFSPRVSVLLRGDPWTVRASAGGGYFAPTPFTEEVESVGLTRLAPLPEELKAERGRSLSLDIGRQVGPVEANLTLFASDVRDPVMVERTPEGTLVMANGEEAVRTWGTEVLGRYHLDPFHVTGTYVYLRAQETVTDGRREVPLTPQHTAGLVGAWEDEEWGRVGVEFYLTGRQDLEDDPYREVSRAFVILGFLAEHKLTSGLRVFLNAENLLDARQTRWNSLVRPTQAPDGRWTTDVWAPLEGRAFNAGVRVSF
jgi:iron complex outermembrane receptor protein